MTTEITLQTTINTLFASKTPKQFIKTRPGANGMSFPYVPIGYVINQLNNAFGPFWEFKVVDKQIGKKQLWIQGQLTIKDPKSGLTITKETFGGADIKVSKATGESLDIANDLKSAVSDCTKKCASMFGIAADVFFKEQDQYEQAPAVIDVEEESTKSYKEVYQRKYFAMSADKGIDGELAKKLIKEKFNVNHFAALSISNLQTAITDLNENNPT